MTRVLLGHPSSQLYGADRMLLATAEALATAGCQVTVAVPDSGPLDDLLAAAGVDVVRTDTPVLRKSDLSAMGAARFARAVATALPSQRRLARTMDVVVANTLTVPSWLAAGWHTGARVVCHVHEAEEDLPGPVRAALLAPLGLADALVCNSLATAEHVRSSWVARRAESVVVHNGVPAPPHAEPAPRPEGRVRLLVVGRLSPRKGQDVALAALSALVARGHDAVMDLVGDVFPGYEPFRESLMARAALSDLAGRVSFHGFVADPGPHYDGADVVLVPSRTEPFGNVAVEAMAHARPVVASDVQGLREVLAHGGGLLVTPDDAIALADAVDSLLHASPQAFCQVGSSGRQVAVSRFSDAGYRERIVPAVLGRT